MPIANIPNLVEVDGKALHETHDAVMFDFGGDSHVWIPKSTMEDWPDIGDVGTVLVEEWIAVEKELI